ncbi:MAG: hypothetical protein HOE05_12130 [Rhodospirillaceae bacterium]|nr:hypothetical protein [Rhodospirillaceae bacterium]MBT4168877.1 hypothetical protein [Rhodospirillaceae bacterium]MBT5126740.1 hypothetical protein [Rhodospirillaceae bacterium]MBT7633823.1 hypothetical protein [Rhodospirillaceae bacterium]MBT7834765.1 hypothetical protein [Rhodospirillaceae bacterium]
MDRRLSGRTVSITIDLPIELAEYLAEDGMQLIATVQHAVRKFKRNPPPDLAAIAKAEREEKLHDAIDRLIRTGRQGARHLRQIEAMAFSNGEERPKGADYQIWKRVALRDIAFRLGITFEYLDLAIRRFRSYQAPRIKARRLREVVRHARLGRSNGEIGAIYGISPGRVSRLIGDAIGRTRGKSKPGAAQ